MRKEVLYPEVMAILARKGITGADLARLINVDKSTIYKKLSGNRSITVEDLNTWSEALNLNSTEKYILFEDVISGAADLQLKKLYPDAWKKKHSQQ